MNLEQTIKEFHIKFDNAYEGPPRQLPDDLQQFRNKFLFEELEEYVKAVEEKNLEKQFDALIDLVYVAIGTAYIQGFPFTAGWSKVHIANMKKIRATHASQSVRNSTYDVIKPPGWIAPDLSAFVKP